MYDVSMLLGRYLTGPWYDLGEGRVRDTVEALYVQPQLLLCPDVSLHHGLHVGPDVSLHHGLHVGPDVSLHHGLHVGPDSNSDCSLLPCIDAFTALSC